MVKSPPQIHTFTSSQTFLFNILIYKYKHLFKFFLDFGLNCDSAQTSRLVGAQKELDETHNQMRQILIKLKAPSNNNNKKYKL